jgi:purine catabolism regulator
LGFDPAKPYRAAIAVLPEELPLGREGFLRRDAVASRVREALRGYGAAQLVSVVLDRVPFLAPDQVDLDALAGTLDASVSIVVGRTHCGVEGARASYRQALSLLRYRSRTRVCSFDDVLVPRVIGGDPEARRTFVDDLMTPLLQQRGGKNLAGAVLALARNGFAMKETAAALGIHTNTLRYRLTRAAEVLGVRLDEPDVRFELQLAAKLMELDGDELLSAGNSRPA